MAPSSTDDVAHFHACLVVEAMDGGGEPSQWRLLCVVDPEEQVLRIVVVSMGHGLGCRRWVVVGARWETRVAVYCCVLLRQQARAWGTAGAV
jgi:hypothetical protein